MHTEILVKRQRKDEKKQTNKQYKIRSKYFSKRKICLYYVPSDRIQIHSMV